jgi:acyl-CoA synthetase (AMP-forming)/AMP-acid ligase II
VPPDDREPATVVPPSDPDATNVAELARRAVSWYPDRAAFILPGYGSERSVSFAELGALVDRFAAGLDALGLPGQSRLLLLAPPTTEIYALALAVLRTGHTLVTIDGRQETGRIRQALREAAPDIVVGTPRGMRWWPFVPALRHARRFTAGSRVFGTRGLGDLLEAGASSASRDPVDLAPESAAVIAFSSGNTGLPKRVVRTHAVLSAQHRALLSAFPLPDSDVNLPGFPLAVLHNLCRGITTVLPPVDLRLMAAADVATVLQTIRDHRVTSISGAPAFIARLAAHLLSRGESLREVRRIVVGGGPVSRRLAGDVRIAFPAAVVRVVYGATEAEPIATAPVGEILVADGAVEGYLAGWPVAGVEIRVDGEDECGELLVRGAHVVPSELDGGWHRTGDIARVDERGCLWLLGRVGAEIQHDGRTVHPFVVEARVACQPGVAAVALVAHNAAPEGELFVQVEADADPHIVAQSARYSLSGLGLAGIPVRVVDVVPMDARHHSKVDRAALVHGLEKDGR